MMEKKHIAVVANKSPCYPRPVTHGILEDIGAEIGYTATTTLVCWFGGQNLYVPAVAEEDHAIARLIGMPAFRRLVAAWGTEILCLPEGAQVEREERDRVIAGYFLDGLGAKAISELTGLSERRIQQLRTRLEASGLLPLIMHERKKTVVSR